MRKARNVSRRKGGAASVMPLQYYNPEMHGPSADAGRDLLKAIPPLGVRPRIGGKRRTTRKTRKSKGGFVPSVMNSFVMAASKYIVPVALFAGYRLMTRRNKRGTKQTRRH